MSGKKNPIKKPGRKDFITNYEPLFAAGNRSEQRRSNSLTPDKNRRQTIPGEIPNILKRNIAALSESTESIKLTDFGKSFVTDPSTADKTPPKKKQKSLFDRLQYDDSQNIELAPTGIENKRLKKLGHQHPAIISSPSMFEIKPSFPRSPEQKFPSNIVSYVKQSTTFDKLKFSEKPLNESKVNAKEETIVKDNSKDEATSKEVNDKSNMEKEKSVAESSSSSSDFAVINEPIKLDENIIKEWRESVKNSMNNLRRMVNMAKGISEQIFAFRQELADGVLNDFPSTPDE